MSRSAVDEQVVKMSFDNSNFDSNVDSSIKTLNKLDARLLNLNKDNFNKLTNSFNNLSNTLSVKGQIMLGFFTKLGNELYNLGKKALNKIFEGPRSGLKEYETLIDATQTIFENVKQDGKGIDDVNSALDELNDYADKTIYNFTEMTRMIGMFTSAGVKLDKSVNTIKGLANSAALVGANAQKAEIAWRAVSRAMSTGKFTNLTWKSLEMTNIAGKQFQTVIKEVARVNKVTDKHGRNIDKMIKKYGSLRESLKEGWLTKDIFNQAMEIMSGDMTKADLEKKGYTKKQIEELMKIAESAKEAATRVKTFRQLVDTTKEAIGSGWTESFRIIIGNLEQARKLYTSISQTLNDFIDNNAKIRNKLLKDIFDFGSSGKTGRDDLDKILKNMLAGVITFIKSVKTGFLNIFPIDRIADGFRNVLKTVEKFTRAFVLNAEEVDKNGNKFWNTKDIDKVTDSVKDLIRFFRGLASVVDIAWMAISQPISAVIKHIPFFNNFFENVSNGVSGIVNGLGKFGDKITVFRNAIKDTNLFGEAVDYLFENIDALVEESPLLYVIVTIFRTIKNAVLGAKNAFDSMEIKPITTLFGALKLVVTALWNALNGIFGIFKGAASSVDWSWLEGPKNFIKNILKTLNDYGAGLITFQDVTDRIKNSFGGITNVLGSIFNAIKDFVSGLFSNFNKAKNISNDLADNVDDAGKKITNTVENSTNTIKDKFGGIASFIKNTFGKVASVFGKIKMPFQDLGKNITLIAAGLGVSGLAVSRFVKNFQKAKIIANINNLIQAGTNVLNAYQRQANSKMILNIAAAVGVLAAALLVLSVVPYENLENGLVIFSSFMGILALTIPPILNAMTKFNNSISGMNDSVKPLNNLINQLGKFGKKISKGINSRMIGKMFKDIAIAILILVAAMIALKIAFKKPEDIIFPLAAIAGTVLIITAAVGSLIALINSFNKSTKKLKPSVEIFKSFFTLSGVSKIIKSLAVSMLILSASLLVLSKIPKESWGRTIVTFVVVFGMLSGLMITITALSKNAGSSGKLKKVTLSITGALLAIAAIFGILALMGDADKMAVALLGVNGILLSMAIIINSISKMKIPKNMGSLIALFAVVTGSLISVVASIGILVSFISKNNSDAWKGALISLGVLFSLLAGSTIALLEVAKHIGGKTTIWTKIQAMVAVMSGAILTIAASTYIIGKVGPIPTSVFVLLGGLVAVIGGIIAIAALIASKGGVFSQTFVKTVMTVGIVISAIVSSFALTLLAVTALVKAFNEISLSSEDVGKVSQTVTDRIASVTTMILTVLPQIEDLFGKIGYAFGSAIISFIESFVDRITELGSRLMQVAEKVITLVLDLLEKIVESLSNKKAQIANIIKKGLEVIAGIITELINSFFHGEDGKGVVNESTVSKWLGIGSILVIVSKFGTKIIGIVSGIYKVVKPIMTGIGKAFKSLWTAVAKTSTGGVLSTAASVAAIGVAAVGVTASLYGLYKGFTWALKGETDDLNANIKDVNGVMADSSARSYSIVNGMAKLGRLIWETLLAVFRAIAGAFSYLISWISDGIATIVKFVTSGFSGILDTANNLITTIEKVTGKTVEGSDSIKKWKKNLDDLNNGLGGFGAHMREQGNNFYKQIGEGFSEAWNNEWTVFGVTEKWYKEGEKGTQALTAGSVKGLDSYFSSVSGEITKQDQKVLGKWNEFWDRHSPSKVTEDLYKDIVLGCAQGVKKNGKKVQNALRKNQQIECQVVKSGADAIDAIMEKWGLKEVESVRNLTVEMAKYDSTNKTVSKETITLNRDYLEILENQKDALKDKNREQAIEYIKGEAYRKGLKIDTAQIAQLVDYTISLSNKHANVTTDAIDRVTNNTQASIVDLVGEESAAMDMVIDDTYQKYREMTNIVKDHESELVGMKKEEAQQFLYEEARKRGFTEEEARETAKATVDQMYAGKKAKSEISKDELKDTINTFDKELEAYDELERLKTSILQKASDNRGKIRELEAKKAAEEAAGTWNYQKQKDYMAKVNSLTIQNSVLKNEYDAIIKKMEASIKKDKLKSDKELDKSYKEAKNLINKNKSKQRGSFKSVLSQFKDMLGLGSGSLNLDSWNMKDDKDGGKGGKGDKDKDPVKKAKDLKTDLEKNRADLTPTFDLDKLASEANKANGIVMSSLMAAQNASIGDYINKDSELNPFMKDRWQNVYNFTQNNYSPKALSRIDIYRQTERQISMSRGF